MRLAVADFSERPHFLDAMKFAPSHDFESSFRRDAETNARDERATRTLGTRARPSGSSGFEKATGIRGERNA